MKDKKEEIRIFDRYVNNLSEAAVRQLAFQILCYPETHDIFELSAREFDRAYRYPMSD